MTQAFKDNLEYIGLFLLIFLGTMLVAFIVDRFWGRLIKRSTAIMKNDPTNYQFFRHALTFVIYTVGFSMAIYVMPNLRTIANSLLAGAGILAVAVGFASQHALSNIISGVFIRELQGIVEDITLRHTVIRDFENRRILIPNAVISNEIIINADFEDGRILKWIEMDITYDSDIDLAKEIMREEILAHPLNIDGRSAEQMEAGKTQVEVRVIQLGSYFVKVRAWAWAKDQSDAFNMACDLNESIKKRFDAANIRFPDLYHSLVSKPDIHV
jgi:small conductance mechanosensitive channel